MATVLVTGANRGIGLAFASHYAEAGDQVIATCRTPKAAKDLAAIGGRVRVEGLDVADPKTIERLAKTLKGEPIDILINNAGTYGGARQSFGAIDYAAWEEAFRVNAMGPMRMAEAFADNVAASERRLIACLSSEMGSITNTPGGTYAYRSSKAALNMVGRGLSHDLAGKKITVLLVHPGWVSTDMGGAGAPVSPERSASDLATLFERAVPAQSGHFFDHRGAALSW